VSFTATVSGGTAPYSFSWNFGDTTTGIGNPVSHTYPSKGSFTVTLTVTDGNGVVATASHTVVVVPLALTVHFTFSPTSPQSGQPVTFTATVSGGTTPYGFSWNFGDTMTGTGNPITHSYTVTATTTFTVTLTITDANTATATASHQVTVTPFVSALVVDFGPTTTIVGNTTFVSSITGGTSPYSCSWSFGDGTPAQTGCTPTHTYIASGTFSATLTVTDSSTPMLTSAKSHAVTVEPNPAFIRGKVKWTHHMSAGTTQTFTALVNNPTTFTTSLTVTIDVFRDTGAFVTRLTVSTTLAPGASNLNLQVSFVPADVAKYHFTATVMYSATIPAKPLPGTTMVVGLGKSKSGSFSAV